MANSLNHANHNRDACVDLRQGNKFHDWCITTAFYSALHYVDLKIFPFIISEQKCTNLKEAQQKLRTPDLHETRAKLVELQCTREIAQAYRWLKTTAHTSRYITYKITPTQADKAIEMLGKIEKYCS